MQPEPNPYVQPQAPLDDPANASEKGLRDLEVVAGAIRPLAEYRCLLTGQPAGLVPVTLRRMLLVPPFWIGYRATIVLPLAKKPFLIPWQYARMLRPVAAFIVLFSLMHVITEEKDRWESPLGRLSRHAQILVGFGLPIVATVGAWVCLGLLMRRFEFVRLLYFNRTDGLVKVRFSKASLARRAREVLVVRDPPP